MSPTSLGANPLATSSLPGPHVPYWRQNPAPEDWKLFDGRQHYLQTHASHSLFLEMHPNVTRGVLNYTKYCVLNILFLNLTTNVPNFGWSTGERNENRGAAWSSNTTPLHVIRSNFTGRYLCMDNNSVVYQSENFSYHQCAFRHEYQEKYVDRYFRLMNDSIKWYLGMNKDGSMLCGNSTTKQPKRVNFTKGIYSKTDLNPIMTEAAPVDHRDAKVTCCKKKQCRKNRRRRLKCRKKWCRSYRRKFFKLSLKELRKYFKHCVKKIRHCKQKKAVDR